MSLLLRWGAAGVLIGAVWGVFLRVWMRLLVAYGEFSWSGTLLIIGCSAAAGTGLALVRAARQSGRGPGWRWAALLAAPLVLFPQGVVLLLPAMLLGGLVISGRPPLTWRILLAALTSAPLVVLAMTFEAEPTAMPLPIVLVVLATLLVALAAAGAEVFRRWPDPAPDVSVDRPSSSLDLGEDLPRARLTTSSGARAPTSERNLADAVRELAERQPAPLHPRRRRRFALVSWRSCGLHPLRQVLSVQRRG